MKKWLITIVLCLLPIGIIAFNSKFYYPQLPIDSVTKKEVLKAINQSSKEMVKIAEENGYEWFITRMDQGKARENLKEMIREQGWKFREQMGSGYIFDKEDKRLIAETEMWTGNYVIVQVPNTWDIPAYIEKELNVEKELNEYEEVFKQAQKAKVVEDLGNGIYEFRRSDSEKFIPEQSEVTSFAKLSSGNIVIEYKLKNLEYAVTYFAHDKSIRKSIYNPETKEMFYQNSGEDNIVKRVID